MIRRNRTASRTAITRLLLVVSLAGVSLTLQARPASAYVSHTRDWVYSWWAYPALYERYVFGGASGFIDNNVWDAYPYEGQDCSSYVSKAWGLPRDTDRNEQNFRTSSMYTGTWYANQASGAILVGWNDGAPNYFMNAFVWHQPDIIVGGVNKADQHMGLLVGFNYSTGYYSTYEALNSSTGVVAKQRTWMDIETRKAWYNGASVPGKRFVRYDWSA